MVNSVSLFGLLIFLWGLVAAVFGGFQIFFLLQRRADTTPIVIGKTVIVVIQSLGRLIALPLSGGILFLQGWRLDPLLQIPLILLGLGIIVESLTGILGDYNQWRNRLGRARASIITDQQPSDLI